MTVNSSHYLRFISKNSSESSQFKLFNYEPSWKARGSIEKAASETFKFHRSTVFFKSQYCATGEFICILFLDCDPSLYYIANILLIMKMMSAETKQPKDVETDKKPSSKPAEQAELDDMLHNFFPGISYFIAFTPSESCDPESLFIFLRFQNTEAEISYIKTRVKYDSEEKENTERLSRDLFSVLKDHDNEAVQHFAKLSCQFCYTKELSEMVYDWFVEVKEAVGN